MSLTWEPQQPKDYADDERQSRVASWQPDWYAAIGMCICLLSAMGIVWLIAKIVGLAY